MLELIFPEHRRIALPVDFKSHLTRKLAGVGIQSFEPLSQAAFLAAAERVEGEVIDIGANIGIFSLLTASALGRPAHAFEPFGKPARVLSRAVERTGLPITVNEAAVSDFDGSATLYLSRRSDMSNSLDASHRVHAGQTEVTVCKIDSYVGARRIAAIKIDTERTEIQVLRGMTQLARTQQPAILLEVLPETENGPLEQWASEAGYQVHRLADDPAFQAITVRRDLPDRDGDGRNALLLPTAAPADAAFYKRVEHWLDRLAACALQPTPA
ncbi:MAG: FkbM family methyltransferase [Pseudomonadota bacterium]